MYGENNLEVLNLRANLLFLHKKDSFRENFDNSFKSTGVSAILETIEETVVFFRNFRGGQWNLPIKIL